MKTTYLLYVIALSSMMSVCAKTYNLKKYNVARSIKMMVEKAKKNETYDTLPQIIKDTWTQIENGNYEVESLEELKKISNAMLKHALKRK